MIRAATVLLIGTTLSCRASERVPCGHCRAIAGATTTTNGTHTKKGTDCVVDPATWTLDGFDSPVGSGRVTDAHDGDGYYDAQQFGSNRHCGEDWNGEDYDDLGDPVFAVADGAVTYRGVPGPGWGQVLVIEHRLGPHEPVRTRTVWSQYAHLSASMVHPGDFVFRGQQIGKIGDAGGRYRPHLHFELRWRRDRKVGGTGYDCTDETSGMLAPGPFIDAHRPKRRGRPMH